MTTNPKDNSTEQADNAAITPDETPVESSETDAEAPVSEEDVILRLAKENEDLKDQMLRLAAEMENLRRRTQRDVADARSYGVSNFARDMLTVADNLQLALQNLPADAKESENGGLKALAEGVEMVDRVMVNTLEKHGVKRINPLGERFDPHFHQAMFEVPSPETPAGTVLQVVQPGFVIGDRVLRPAMVGVATGGPKSPAA